MGFARYGRLQVLAGRTYRQPRGRITTLLQILQMAVGVTSFPFRGLSKHSRNIVIPLYIGLGRKIQITSVCLRLSGKCIFEMLFCLTPLECHITTSITELLKNFSLR